MQRRTVLLIPSNHCGWPVLRQTLAALDPQVTIVGEAITSDQARALAAEHHPDVLVAADWFDELPTLSLLTDLRRILPATTFVLVSAHFDPRSLDRLVAVGVSGHILWRDLSPEALRECLSLVTQSTVMVISREVADAFLAQRVASVQAPFPLTERERSILQLLASGLTRDEIGPRLGMSTRTVKRIISGVEDKLDAPTPFVLGLKVGELGLLNR